MSPSEHQERWGAGGEEKEEEETARGATGAPIAHRWTGLSSPHPVAIPLKNSAADANPTGQPKKQV